MNLFSFAFMLPMAQIREVAIRGMIKDRSICKNKSPANLTQARTRGVKVSWKEPWNSRINTPVTTEATTDRTVRIVKEFRRKNKRKDGDNMSNRGCVIDGSQVTAWTDGAVAHSFSTFSIRVDDTQTQIKKDNNFELDYL